MRSLLAIKIKALHLLDTLTGPLKEVLAEASSNDGQDICTNSLTINFNQIDVPGFAIDAKILLLSSELAKEQLRLRTLHNFPQDATTLFGISIAIKPEGVADVSALLDELTSMVNQMIPGLAASFVFEGHNLCFGCDLAIFVYGQTLAK